MPIQTSSTTAVALIVDNDPNARLSIERYLTARGVAYDTAEDPRSAIQRLTQRSYDYLFLDLDLGAGIQDGEGILAWMRRHSISIPTVLLSEAAGFPNVIRLEKAFTFVKLRMTHGDLQHLGDMVDELMDAKARVTVLEAANRTPPNERSRAVFVALLLATFVVIVLVLSLVMRWLQPTGFVVVTGVAFAILVVILAAIFFDQGRLSEKGFLSLMREMSKKFGTPKR